MTHTYKWVVEWEWQDDRFAKTWQESSKEFHWKIIALKEIIELREASNVRNIKLFKVWTIWEEIKIPHT